MLYRLRKGEVLLYRVQPLEVVSLVRCIPWYDANKAEQTQTEYLFAGKVCFGSVCPVFPICFSGTKRKKFPCPQSRYQSMTNFKSKYFA